MKHRQIATSNGKVVYIEPKGLGVSLTLTTLALVVTCAARELRTDWGYCGARSVDVEHNVGTHFFQIVEHAHRDAAQSRGSG